MMHSATKRSVPSDRARAGSIGPDPIRASRVRSFALLVEVDANLTYIGQR